MENKKLDRDREGRCKNEDAGMKNCRQQAGNPYKGEKEAREKGISSARAGRDPRCVQAKQKNKKGSRQAEQVAAGGKGKAVQAGVVVVCVKKGKSVCRQAESARW